MHNNAIIFAALASSSLAHVLPFKKSLALGRRGAKLARQAVGSVNLPMTSGTQFQVGIGTPQQSVTWGIDTGSHYAVVSGSNSAGCSSGGCFDTTQSSTWVAQSGDCGEGFLGGGVASDTAFNSTDTVSIGGYEVDNVALCINQAASSGTGLLGLNIDPVSGWPSFLSGLRDNYIERASIAIWLNEAGADSGEITFGAIDSTKFNGGLTVVPWQSEADGTYNNLRAPFTGFGLTDADGTNWDLAPSDWPGRAPALDTGDPGLSLPVDLYNALWSALGVVNSTSTDLKTVPCNLANSPANLTFTFGDSITFNTPLSIWVADQFEESIILPDGTAVPACKLNIDADPGDNGLLGQPLQHYMYNVFDYENKQIAMGQAVQGTPNMPDPESADDGTDGVTTIGSGIDIPGATSTATGTGVVVTTGKDVQTEDQVTTVVNGATGLVYSTPAFNLGVNNPGPGYVSATAPTTVPFAGNGTFALSTPPPAFATPAPVETTPAPSMSVM